MALPFARSVREEHLFMELYPCQCGETQFSTSHALLSLEDGGMGSRHEGDCAGCGTRRTFIFRMPVALATAPGYGGREPSQLIDAGEWLMVAHAIAGSPQAHALLPEKFRCDWELQTCLDCLDEAIKFLPEGANEMPNSAIWTDRGRRYGNEQPPGSMRRDRMMAYRSGIVDYMNRQ